MKPIVFWGARGQAIVLNELVNMQGYELIALFDNDVAKKSPFKNVPIFHGMEGLKKWSTSRGDLTTSFLVAIGGDFGRDRVQIYNILVTEKLKAVKAIHKSAYVASDCSLGMGTQVLANATVCSRAKIGRTCIINTAASIDHECEIGDGVHIAPGVNLCGLVKVGDFSMVGAGAVILPRVSIGTDVTVGAGTIVTGDIPDGYLVYGNPIKRIKKGTS